MASRRRRPSGCLGALKGTRCNVAGWCLLLLLLSAVRGVPGGASWKISHFQELYNQKTKNLQFLNLKILFIIISKLLFPELENPKKFSPKFYNIFKTE